MNTNLHKIVAAASLALPLSANALLVTPSIDVIASDGYYNIGLGGTDIGQYGQSISLGSYGNSPGLIETAYPGNQLVIDHSYSYTDFYGVTASAYQSAQSNLEFRADLVPNSGGEFIFYGFGEADAFVRVHGGCTDLGGLPVCNDASASASGQSSYSLVFELLAPYEFSFTGSTVGDGYFELRDIAGSYYVTTLTGTDGYGTLGILQPGEYVLYGLADAVVGAGTSSIITDAASGVSSRFDYYLALTPAVPVPAAAWLFGSGLLGLLAVSRRKAAS